MSVLLPSCPYPARRDPTLIDFGGLQGGTLGGPYTKLNRMGNRHSLDVSLPSGQASGIDEATYRTYISALKRGLSQGVILAFPQMALVTGITGAPVVNGDGQSGSILVTRGFTPNAYLLEGRFFSLIHDGRRYVHSLDADTQVVNDGTATFAITPMLRVSPADGDTLEFDAPMIEGWLKGNGVSWTTDYAYQVGLSFSIVEAA